MAALGLRCCARAFSSCGEHGLLLVAVLRLLIAVASPAAEHGLQAHGPHSRGSRALERRLSSCGTRAQLLRGMRDPPGPGHEPVSPALAGGLVTTAPPGKSSLSSYNEHSLVWLTWLFPLRNVYFSYRSGLLATNILYVTLLTGPKWLIPSWIIQADAYQDPNLPWET